MQRLILFFNGVMNGPGVCIQSSSLKKQNRTLKGTEAESSHFSFHRETVYLRVVTGRSF